jgi:general secretion pathway protein M
VTPAAIARLSPPRQRALALALFGIAVALLLALVLGPIVLLHRHYNAAIADTTDRLERYRRVAAQAPDLRRALDVIKEKDGRRFYLKNTAPNLASAELSDLVRGAIENNGGRITTSQNPGSREEGAFRQLTVNVQFFATTANLAKILAALDTAVPFLVVENLSVRPLNAFRGFKPAPGQEPENNVQLDVSALAYPEPVRLAAPAK